MQDATTIAKERRGEEEEGGGKFGLAGKFEMFRNRCCGNLVRPRVKLKPCNRVTMEGNTCCQQVRNLPRPSTNREQLRTGGAEFFLPRHALFDRCSLSCHNTSQLRHWLGHFFSFLRIYFLAFFLFLCLNCSLRFLYRWILERW